MEADRRGHVVGRAFQLELSEEPEPLLPEGEGAVRWIRAARDHLAGDREPPSAQLLLELLALRGRKLEGPLHAGVLRRAAIRSSLV